MEKQKTSNKESFQKIQKYKAIIGVLSITSALLAFSSINLYSQLQELPPRFADVEGVAIENKDFIPGSGMGGGSRMASDKLTPVLDPLVESNDITDEQVDLILEAFNSYDPFN